MVELTPEDDAAIQRLQTLGFDRASCVVGVEAGSCTATGAVQLWSTRLSAGVLSAQRAVLSGAVTSAD